MDEPPDIDPDPPDLRAHSSDPPSPAAFITVSSQDVAPQPRKRSRHSNNDGPPEEESPLPLGQISQSSVDIQPGQKTPPSNFSTPLSPPPHLQISQSQNEKLLTQTPASQFSLPVGRKLYQTNDQGPYVVHVQKIETNPGSSLNPIAFGQFLSKNPDLSSSILEGSMKRIGRNKISINFDSANNANVFLNSSLLTSHKFNSFIPTFNITKMGVVRGIPNEWTEDELLEYIKVPSGFGAIIKTRRLNYKVLTNAGHTWKASQSVVLTFDGQKLPPRVFCCFNSLPVEMYTYPTIQCFNCCRFGHTKTQCRSTPRCYRCGQGHIGQTCETNEDTSKCLHCSGSHFSTSKNCPEYSRQQNIKKTMADKSLSYLEASRCHAPSRLTYADATRSPTGHSSSYKKTFIRSPRAAPQLTKGYDAIAHGTITKEPPSSLGNGTALLQSPLEAPSPSNSVVDQITNLLIQLSSDKTLPSHVATLITLVQSILSLYHGFSQNDTMEHPKYQK